MDKPDVPMAGTGVTKGLVAQLLRTMFISSTVPFGASLIWNTRALPKVRFFFWLVLHRRCWIVKLRMRHGLQDKNNCILCSQASETLDHILLGCVFSHQVWFSLLERIGLADVVARGDINLFVWWMWCHRRAPRYYRKGFNSLVMLTY